MVAFISLILSLLLSLVFTPIVIRISTRKGWIVQPRKDRWHSKPTALMGGIAIFLSFSITSFVFKIFDSSNILIYLALGTMFFTGLVDDLFEIKPIVKLIGQVTCTLILLYYEFYFGNGVFYWIGIPLTFFWVIGITNSINLLDNMDGLSAGISATISLFSGIIFYQHNLTFESIFSFSIAGSALGFLFYNFNPAKIFMGDTGSLFLGFSLSFMSLSLQKNIGSINGFFVIVLPLALMAIPILDTSMVTIKRAFAGRKISRGGKDHTSHRLVALGISERKSVVILYLASILWGLASLFLLKLEFGTALLFLLLLTVFSLVFVFLLSSVKVYDESEEKLTYLRIRGMNLGNVFFLRFFLMNKKLIVGILIDISIIYTSFILSAKITNTPIGSQYFILGLIILVKIISFYIFNLYNRLWRYISTNELFTQFSSVITATIAFFLLVYSSSFKSIFGVSFYIVDFFITLSGIIFARLSYRILRESFSNISSIKTKKTLIYGAGDAGNLLLKELMQSNKYSFRPVGWIDDDVTKKNMILGGLKVYGGEKELKSIIFKTGAEVVIISSKLFDNNRMNRVRNILDSSSIELGVFNIDLSFNNTIT